jgi:hypothetical protein
LSFCAWPTQTVALMAAANNQIVFLTFHLRKLSRFSVVPVNESLQDHEYDKKSLPCEGHKHLFFNGLRCHLRASSDAGRRGCAGAGNRRQAKEKGRAEPEFALHANVAPMGLDDVLGD